MTFPEQATEIVEFLDGETTLPPELLHEALQQLTELVLAMAHVVESRRPPARQTTI